MNEIIILILKVLYCLVYVSIGFSAFEPIFSKKSETIAVIRKAGRYLGGFIAMTILLVKYL